MLEFMGLKGLDWGKSNIINFWLVGISAVETETTFDGRVGWIKGDSDGSWEQALNQTALLLIRMYCIVLVDLPQGVVCNIALCSLLRSIATFEFGSIRITQKAILACTSYMLPHSMEGLEAHQ